MELEFDLIGCYPSMANAFRRLMISEVPSMAIEKVYIYNNTSIIQDEVLAHRLGLIPLKADPRGFEFKVEGDVGNSNDNGKTDGTEIDTLEYQLKVKCTRRKDAKDISSFDGLYINHSIYSGQMKWLPKGQQSTIYKDADVLPIHNDILISKMRPGHELDLKLLAVKGIGKDHAKFSPVATASYRLLPKIIINRPVTGSDAELLQKCFSPGVIGINAEGAFVIDGRHDTCSRNFYRYQQLRDAVTLCRVRDHFIFNVESVGALKPEIIFIEAVKCLKRKCRQFLDEIQGLS